MSSLTWPVFSLCDLFRYVDGLKNLVNRYHSLMDSLNDATFLLLAEQIQELRKVLHFGCKRLNWNSLGTVHTLGYNVIHVHSPSDEMTKNLVCHTK